MGAHEPIILKEHKVIQKKGLTRKTLERLFSENIVEIRFRRRTKMIKKNYENPVGHMTNYRRMLCTSNWRYIKSPICRLLYNWQRPKTRRGPDWYRKRHLIIVWDIIQNDWRMIPTKYYEILGYTPIKTFLQQEVFTEFYEKKIRLTTQWKKDHFSDL